MKKQNNNEKLNNNDIKKLSSEINSLTKAINKNNELISKQQKEEKQSIVSSEIKPKQKKKLSQRIKSFFETIINYPKELWDTLKFLFTNKENVLEQDASILIKLLLAGLFEIIQILSYIVMICFFIAPFMYNHKNYIFLYILGGFIILMFAQVIRITKLSIQKITDTNQLTGLLSAFTAFSALIVSLIALFK